MIDTCYRKISRRDALAGLGASIVGMTISNPVRACTAPLQKPIYYFHKFTSDFGTTLQRYNAKKAFLVYQTVLDTNHDGKFDGVTSAFKSRVQAAPAGALVALDWEHAFGISGGMLKAVGGREGPTVQKAAMAEYIKAIDAARAIRPDCKFGYYHIPFNGWSYSVLSTTPDWWLAQETSIQPLLSHCDALLPEIYQFYKVGVEITVQEDAKRMTNLANLCERCSKGKPIYPFVWELYHPAGPYDYELISPTQIKLHVGAFTKVSADGLFWWGSSAGPAGTEVSLKAFRDCLDGVYA